MGFNVGLKAKCKRCGQEVPVDELTVDIVYEMAVCAACVKERKLKEKQQRQAVANPETVVLDEKKASPKPAGWDGEDEYLERAARLKAKEVVKAKRIDDQNVLYACKCTARFKYNTKTEHPGRCPFCGAAIGKFVIV